MTSAPPLGPDPDFELVDRLFTLHPPSTPEIAGQMDSLRREFRILARYVVDAVPRTPDRTVALRSLHRACMDAMAAVACNQPGTAEGAST